MKRGTAEALGTSRGKIQKTDRRAGDAGGGPPATMVRTVAVTTLGCKVNQCESAGMAEAMVARGLTLVPFEGDADCYIINTCTVTGKTDSQSRQLIRQAVRRHPGAMVLVTGCYAQRAPEELARIPGVRIVAGHREKSEIPALVEQWVEHAEPQVRVGEIGREKAFTPLGITVFPDHTRAFLKIQDGCDAFCTYCIVPYARGRSRSLPPAAVAENVGSLASAGYREVVLTGIHLGAYGRDLTPPWDLTALLGQLLAERPVERLRLSSLEPREVTEGIMTLMNQGAGLCRHLHIPLQSGDDGVLSAMHRNYDAAFFRNLVEWLHRSVPGLAIGVDVMVGFPGETEAAFANTFRLLEALPVAYLHVFPYSPRPGTPAATLPRQVPDEEKKGRALRLRRLGAQKRRSFAEQFLGQPLAVLIESRTDGATGSALGFSDNYIPVSIRDQSGANRIVRCLPSAFRNGRLLAEVIHE